MDLDSKLAHTKKKTYLHQAPTLNGLKHKKWTYTHNGKKIKMTKEMQTHPQKFNLQRQSPGRPHTLSASPYINWVRFDNKKLNACGVRDGLGYYSLGLIGLVWPETHSSVCVCVCVRCMRMALGRGWCLKSHADRQTGRQLLPGLTRGPPLHSATDDLAAEGHGKQFQHNGRKCLSTLWGLLRPVRLF